MRTSSIIMAGGNGTRFWPKSRSAMPKQFLDLDGNGTLLNQTIERLSKVADTDSIYIVGNEKHSSIFNKSLPESFNKDNVMLEPEARNTAPAIAASVSHLHKKYGNHVIVVIPSDQHILDGKAFSAQLTKAVKAARTSHKVVTLGIKPTYPATGYGYLHSKRIAPDIYTLENFVEKPDEKTAMAYIADESYYWNAGIFVFESEVMLNHIHEQMPDLYDLSKQISDWNDDFYTGKLQRLYSQMTPESIDYGVMEKIDDILMIPLDCGWSDLGSWDALGNVKEADEKNNIIEGNVLSLDASGSTIIGSDKLIAVVGLDDIIVVDTEDALLICHKNDVQKIKAVVSQLKESKRAHLI